MAIGACMIAYAAVWRVSAAETLASMAAIAAGALIALSRIFRRRGRRTAIGPGLAGWIERRFAASNARLRALRPDLLPLGLYRADVDGEGEAALTQAIEGIRLRGGIAIVIAHRPSALVAVDLVAIVQGGRMVAFGKKQDIMTPALQSTAKPAPEELATQVRRPA